MSRARIHGLPGLGAFLPSVRQLRRDSSAICRPEFARSTLGRQHARDATAAMIRLHSRCASASIIYAVPDFPSNLITT